MLRPWTCIFPAVESKCNRNTELNNLLCHLILYKNRTLIFNIAKKKLKVNHHQQAKLKGKGKR